MASIKIEGLEELSSELKRQVSKKTDLSAKVSKWGSQLETQAKQNAQFTKGYSTGATRQNITLTVSGEEAKVQAETEYSGYLEVGTRKMAAQPFMKPALDAIYPQFVEDLLKD